MNILIGIVLAGVTGYTLLADVIVGEETFTPAHAMTLATMVALIGATHALGTQSFLRNFALFLFSMACVTYLIVAAGSRNAELKSAPTRSLELKEQRLQKMIRSAESDLRTLRTIRTTECGSGQGPRCKSARESEAAAAGKLAKLQSDLLELPAPAAPEQQYHSVALLLQPLTNQPAAQIESYLALAMPYIQVVLCELGAALFLLMGMKRAPRPQSQQVPLPKKAKKKVPRRKRLSAKPPREPSPAAPAMRLVSSR